MTHSDALVTELARVHAIAWECHDISPAATFEPDLDDHDRAAIRAVLDHLLAQGWTPTTGDESPLSPGVSWDAHVSWHPPEALKMYRLGPAPRTGVRAE